MFCFVFCVFYYSVSDDDTTIVAKVNLGSAAYGMLAELSIYHWIQALKEACALATVKLSVFKCYYCNESKPIVYLNAVRCTFSLCLVDTGPCNREQIR